MTRSGVLSQESVERFLGRILTDDDFRRMAMGSIRLAMAVDRLTFTQEEMDAVMSVDWSVIELVSGDMDKTIKRSPVSSAMSMPAENDAFVTVAASA